MSERVGLVSLADGTAGLVLVDLNGKMRSKLITDSKLNVDFELSAADERPRISGQVTESGQVVWTR